MTRSRGTARGVVKRSASGTSSSSTTLIAEPSVGILGGTFDPVHFGHLAAAQQLREAAGLPEVWLMPNARPPHRPTPPVAAAGDRLRMVELGLQGMPGLRASDLEVARGGVSYTIDTVRQLRDAEPGLTVWLLLGLDVALGIHSWHEARSVLEQARFVIFNRPGTQGDPQQLGALGFEPARTRVVRIDTPAISARSIRDRLRRNEAIDRLVPPEVARYIAEHRLYRDR